MTHLHRQNEPNYHNGQQNTIVTGGTDLCKPVVMAIIFIPDPALSLNSLPEGEFGILEERMQGQSIYGDGSISLRADSKKHHASPTQLEWEHVESGS